MKHLKVILRNGGRGPRSVNDVRRQPIVVDPGKEVSATLSEHMVAVIRRMDGVLTAEVVGEVDAPDVPTKPSGQAPTQASGDGKQPGGPAIPPEWRDWDWPKMRSMATKVKPKDAPPILNMKQAKATIENYLAAQV